MDMNIDSGAVRTKAASDLFASWRDSLSPITITQDVISSIPLDRNAGDMYVWLQPNYDIYFNFTNDDEYDGTALIDNEFEPANNHVDDITALAGSTIVTYIGADGYSDDFESYADATALKVVWKEGTGASSAVDIALETAAPLAGTNSMRLTCNTHTNSVYDSTGLAVVAGTEYTIEFTYDAEATGHWSYYIGTAVPALNTAPGDIASYFNSGAVVALNATVSTTVTATFTPTSSGTVYLIFYADASAATYHIDIDSIIVSSDRAAQISGGTNVGGYMDAITTVVGAKYRATASIQRMSTGDSSNSILLRKADDTALSTNTADSDSIGAGLASKERLTLSVDFTATATTTYIGFYGSTTGDGNYYVYNVDCKPLSNILAARDFFVPGNSIVTLRIPWGHVNDPDIGDNSRGDTTMKFNVLNKIAVASTSVKFRIG